MTSAQVPTTESRKWIVLSAISIGTFISTLGGSIVNISLPPIAKDFGVGISDIEWIVVAYLLVAGSLLLTFGRLGDIFGYKRVYVGGFALFTAAGTLCGIAQSVGELTALRVAQGVGYAMIQAVGPAIVTAAFPPTERGKALGLNAVSVSVGLSLGPTLGGILTEWFSWRWIFFVNLPIGLFGVIWALKVLSPGGRRGSQRLDVPGALLAGLGLLSLLLAVIEGKDWGWGSARVLLLFAAFAMLGVSFVAVELQKRQPMFDLRLFAIRNFSVGSLSLLVIFVGLFIATFLMPFYLQRGQSYSVLEAGLLFTPLSLSTLIVAPFSGALSDRIGSRFLETAGLAITALGLFSLTSVDAHTGGWSLIWRFATIGFGLGVFSSPNQSSILGSVPRPRLGTASGTVAQMRITGQVFGVAAGGAILASRIPVHIKELSRSLSPPIAHRDALILSIHDALYFAVAVCALGVIASLVRGKKAPRKGREAARRNGVSDEEELLAGVTLAYAARRIEEANGDSPNLIQAASELVESSGETSRREDLAKKAGEEILKPLSFRLLRSYLSNKQKAAPEREGEERD